MASRLAFDLKLPVNKVYPVVWVEFERRVAELANRHRVECSVPLGVYGVPTGGCFVARELARHFGFKALSRPEPFCLIVDDLVDSGRTLEPYAVQGHPVDALYRKPYSPRHLAPSAEEVDGWIMFPWEHVDGPADAVVRLLEYIGEDPNREGLVDTPGRVLRAWEEMTAGYKENPGQILATTFDESSDEMVVLRGISFVSVCEHHMLPFQGTATVAYVPNERVVGISKLARLVDCFARRLQVQERMTRQIADAIEEHLDCKGVGVVVEAEHSCMGCRGVKKPGASLVTSALRGVMLTKPEARAEFLALARGC